MPPAPREGPLAGSLNVSARGTGRGQRRSPPRGARASLPCVAAPRRWDPVRSHRRPDSDAGTARPLLAGSSPPVASRPARPRLRASRESGAPAQRRAGLPHRVGGRGNPRRRVPHTDAAAGGLDGSAGTAPSRWVFTLAQVTPSVPFYLFQLQRDYWKNLYIGERDFWNLLPKKALMRLDRMVKSCHSRTLDVDQSHTFEKHLFKNQTNKIRTE